MNKEKVQIYESDLGRAAFARYSSSTTEVYRNNGVYFVGDNESNLQEVGTIEDVKNYFLYAGLDELGNEEEINAMYETIIRANLNPANIFEYFENDDLTINIGRNGKTYAWLRWDDRNFVVDVETNELIESVDDDGSEEDRFIQEQFC